MYPTATIIESQPDWLTLTSPEDAFAAPFNMWGRAILNHEEAADARMRDWRFKGYEGYHAGRASWGVRPGGAIICLSGDAAAQRLDAACDLAANITRLDIAVTVRLEPADPDVEARHWGEYKAWHAYHDSPMRGSLVASVDGGATLYVGSRKSEAFLRIYNKEVESRDPRTREPEGRYVGCHRYELELKGERARPHALALSKAADSPRLVRGLVASYLADHGIDDALVAESRQELLPGFRRRSDMETKLTWLRTQVRSTVDWLREHNNQAKVLHALGYDLDECVRLLKLEEVRESQ